MEKNASHNITKSDFNFIRLIAVQVISNDKSITKILNFSNYILLFLLNVRN